MKKFDIHICLVSDQATPNYVPLMDKNFRPQEVILLVSQQMKERAKTFKEVLKMRCPQIKQHEIVIDDVYNMNAIKDLVLEHLPSAEPESIALNVTGGNKLMAIAAYGVLHDLGCQAFYFMPEKNEVFLLESNEKFTLQAKIQIEDYLKLHGYTVTQIERKCRYNLPDLTKEIVSKDSVRKVIKYLNFAVTNAQDLVTGYPLCLEADKQAFDYLLSKLEEAKLLQWDHEKIIFADSEAKKYLKGLWFEEHVLGLAAKLEGIQDVAMNIRIESNQDNVRQPNEIDVAYMKDHVLHIIECKTINYEGNDQGQDKTKTNEALYKLETLKKLGGLRTKLMMASCYKLPSFIMDRANGAQIKCVTGAETKGLSTLLANWDRV